jgi:uncharacterized membrane protein
VFWNYLCLNDFPHAWDIGNFKFQNSEHNVNQSRSKQLCFSTAIMFWILTLSLTILRVGIVLLLDVGQSFP